MMGWEMSIETTFKPSIQVAQVHFSAQHGAKLEPGSGQRSKGEQMGQPVTTWAAQDPPWSTVDLLESGVRSEDL